MTKLQKVLEGQSKAQAKGVKRKGIPGYGKAIYTAQDAAHSSVREKILECFKQDDATRALAVQELEQERDKRVKACSGERKAKKVASVRVQFARILTILRAYNNGENRDKMQSAKNLGDMYAFASRKGTARGKVTKPFTADGFKTWSAGVKRVLMPEPSKGKKGEREQFDDSIARLESHIVACLQTLEKHSTVTYLPVKQWVAVARGKGKHLRLVTVKKAA